jgi:hypothetical protein
VIVTSGAAKLNGNEQLIVKQAGDSGVVTSRNWTKEGQTEITATRAWKRILEQGSETETGWALIDETGKALTAPDWGRPWYDTKADPLAGGLISARTKEQKYGLIRRDGTVVVKPEFDRIAWIAPKVAAVWSRGDGGLINAAGEWIFKDTDKVRIARFGLKNARSTERQHQHGLALIEDVPKWGYARLNR